MRGAPLLRCTGVTCYTWANDPWPWSTSHEAAQLHRRLKGEAVVKRSRLPAVLIGLALFGHSNAAVTETKTDPRLVWPKNSQFNCSGILIQGEGTYQLKPDEGMLVWCDAEIEGKDKGRILDACTVGNRCEIKGVIRGHGAFLWVKITSVRPLSRRE
jgi:hypothetical protein